MKNIKEFESYNSRINENIDISFGVNIWLLSESLSRVSNIEEIEEKLFEWFSNLGMDIDKTQKGNPFGSVANAVGNTAEIISETKDPNEIAEEISKLWILVSKMNASFGKGRY